MSLIKQRICTPALLIMSALFLSGCKAYQIEHIHLFEIPTSIALIAGLGLGIVFGTISKRCFQSKRNIVLYFDLLPWRSFLYVAPAFAFIFSVKQFGLGKMPAMIIIGIVVFCFAFVGTVARFTDRLIHRSLTVRIISYTRTVLIGALAFSMTVAIIGGGGIGSELLRGITQLRPELAVNASMSLLLHSLIIDLVTGTTQFFFRTQMGAAQEVEPRPTALGMVSDCKQKGEQNMSVGQALFSFQGRMCRRDYWLKGFLVLLPVGIVRNILAYGVDNDGARMVSMVIGIASLWPTFALIVKRLHDRNRSGWFAATMLIPIANIVFAIWIIVEVWFLRGTVGQNRFGEDPVQETA